MVELNSSVFWVITRREVVGNRRLGSTYRSHLQGSSSPILTLEDFERIENVGRLTSTINSVTIFF